ncbi:subunit of protein modulating antibiotic efflux [compost metagenome]
MIDGLARLRRCWSGGISLRLRFMLGAAVLAVLFMLALVPAVRGAFVIALKDSINLRLASDASALIAAARVQDGHLDMPDKLPDEEYDNLAASQLGFIYDSEGKLVWQSRSSLGKGPKYMPRYDGEKQLFLEQADDQGEIYFIYDVEIDLLRGRSAAFIVVTMQPRSDYQAMYEGFVQQLYIWLGGAFVVLLGLLWFGLTMGFRSLRQLSA